jgi:predicted nucleotidyltransferase
MAKRGLLELFVSAGDERADETLRALVTACEAAFPGRVRSYLLSGSYAGGDATPESDLDIGVLFRGTVSDDERQRLFRLSDAIERLAAIRLDVVALDEEQYLRSAPASALEAVTIYGDDVRGELILEPLAHALARALSAATFYIWQIRGLRQGLIWSLDYPDPGGEFFGYERYGMFQGRGADEVYTPGARTILNCATMIAAARLTHAGQRVPSKRRCVELYAELAPGESSTWLADLYTACKARWGYRVPDSPAERAELRALCAPMLAFENEFLAFARPLNGAALIAQDDYGWPRACDRLRWVAYPDLAAPDGEVGVS